MIIFALALPDSPPPVMRSRPISPATPTGPGYSVSVHKFLGKLERFKPGWFNPEYAVPQFKFKFKGGGKGNADGDIGVGPSDVSEYGDDDEAE